MPVQGLTSNREASTYLTSLANSSYRSPGNLQSATPQRNNNLSNNADAASSFTDNAKIASSSDLSSKSINLLIENTLSSVYSADPASTSTLNDDDISVVMASISTSNPQDVYGYSSTDNLMSLQVELISLGHTEAGGFETIVNPQLTQTTEGRLINMLNSYSQPESLTEKTESAMLAYDNDSTVESANILNEQA